MPFDNRSPCPTCGTQRIAGGCVTCLRAELQVSWERIAHLEAELLTETRKDADSGKA